MRDMLCPKCNNAISYHVDDYVYICDYCSTTFCLNDHGDKQRITDHFILPNRYDVEKSRQRFFDYLTRNFHKTVLVNKEFFIKKIFGNLMPYWVVSLEANTTWAGHSEKKHIAEGLDDNNSVKFALESGSFNKKYRWSILARNNITEFWGLSRLHEISDPIHIDWDGFSFDENLGKNDNAEKSLYEQREFFNTKFGKGVPIMAPQSDERNAIEKTKEQLNEFHRRIAKTMVGELNEYRTSFEIAGIQLIHIPLWHICYVYRPAGLLKYFYKSTEKWALLNGCTGSIIQFEHPMNKDDKVFINLFISLSFAALFAVLGFNISPLFFILTVFLVIITSLSAVKSYGVRKRDPDLTPAPVSEQPAEPAQ